MAGRSGRSGGRMGALMNASLEEGLLSGSEEPSVHSGMHRSASAGGEGFGQQQGNDEEKALLKRRLQDPRWRLDRGAGYYAEERERYKRESLVQTGKHAGRSRVRVTGLSWRRLLHHKLSRDFFNSAVNAPLSNILTTLALIYTGSLIFWTINYYTLWRLDDTCFSGFNDMVSAALFAVETQQTIGYGTRAPGDCWATFGLVAVHSLVTVVLDSLILGITFARISHPKHRGRTILVSDCACIARRDGDLKFMFRVADIQPRQVMNPSIQALLFTWGPHKAGRLTAEGELLPVQVQELPLDWFDPTMLLPVTVEHTIDEHSPLAGHTMKSLENLGAEIVVIFSATTEVGTSFSIRQSYLPSEIHWGYIFSQIVRHASGGETQHSVDIARFHDVEPQPGLDLVAPHKLAAKVISGSDRGILPPPVRGGSTLVLSDTGVVGARDGRRLLMFRLGDTFPGGQVIKVHVTAYLYRWQSSVTPEGEALPYSVWPIPLSPSRPNLRYPVTVAHDLSDPRSPLSNWVSAAAKRLDADAEVVVIAEGISAVTGLPIVRQRVYPVLAGIRWGALFVPVVAAAPPGLPTSRARHGGVPVDWSVFHSTAPAQMDMVPGTWSSGAITSAAAGGPSDGSSQVVVPSDSSSRTTGQQQPSSSSTDAQTQALAIPYDIRVALPGPESYLGVSETVPHSLDSWNAAAPQLTAAAAQQHMQQRENGRGIQELLGQQQQQQQQPGAVFSSAPAAINAMTAPIQAAATSRLGGLTSSRPVGVLPPAGVPPSQQERAGKAVSFNEGSEGQPSVLRGAGRLSSSDLQQSASSSVRATLPTPPPSIRVVPTKSGENTLSQPSSGATAEMKSDDWRLTRSLFTAMEEMARLAADETQQTQAQPTQQGQ